MQGKVGKTYVNLYGWEFCQVSEMLCGIKKLFLNIYNPPCSL